MTDHINRIWEGTAVAIVLAILAISGVAIHAFITKVIIPNSAETVKLVAFIVGLISIFYLLGYLVSDFPRDAKKWMENR